VILDDTMVGEEAAQLPAWSRKKSAAEVLDEKGRE